MAYDKAVDSVVLDAGLKATADAIREKTGDTELIQWLAESGFKEAVEAIESGGGDILGHKFACGSFTLTEDTTSQYTVLNSDELFAAVKDDFPGATRILDNVFLRGNGSSAILSSFLAAICWLENVDTFSGRDLKEKEFLACYFSKPKLSSGNRALIYTDNYKNYSAKSAIGDDGIVIDSTGFDIGFNSSYIGYAGSKYNWLVFPLDHGEVVEV